MVCRDTPCVKVTRNGVSQLRRARSPRFHSGCVIDRRSSSLEFFSSVFVWPPPDFRHDIGCVT